MSAERFNRECWFVVFVFAAAWILPALCGWGVFVDGLTYASISRNYAEGLGTFWNPYYTDSVHPSFHEQPPLFFLLQSGFFALLGGHYLVEKFYSFVVLAAVLLLLNLIWKRVFEEDRELVHFGWLPCLFCFLFTRWSWAFKSIVIEGTLTLLCLGSLLNILIALRESRRWTSFGHSLLAGILLAAALFTKGVVSLYVLVAVPCLAYGIGGVRTRKLIASSSLLLGVPILCLSLVLLDETAYESVQRYVQEHLLPVVLGNRTDGSNAGRGYILSVLAWQLAIPFGVMVAVLLSYRHAHFKLPRIHVRWMICFLVLALSASVPLLVVRSSRSFYVVPSLPLFALCFAVVLVPIVSEQVAKLGVEGRLSMVRRRLQHCVIFVALVVGAMSVSFIGVPRKDRAIFEDLAQLQKRVAPRSRVGIHPGMFGRWELHAYIQRFLKGSLVNAERPTANVVYVLWPKAGPPPTQGTKVEESYNNFDLYAWP